LLKYRTIPLVKEDPDFEHKMTVNMLERTMGAIMTDIGTNDTFAEEPNNQYFKHLLNLHQQFFNFLMKQLERG
ncbi:MAG TPA: hypothetical protein VJA22_00695, partial [Patescibacteria group bacterium]|nr:hypothetical protein [Patescibacteria group bacterium]